MMETIDDIEEELLSGEFAPLANRVKAAVKALEADRDNWRRQALDEDARANAATCQESLQVGNAAAMYEALKTISKCDISKEEDCYTLYRVCEAALSAPQRNCDLYKSEPEAYQAYLTAMKNATKKTYVYFEPWLFEKAKGE